MKSKLPDYMKCLVKQQWLQRLPRDTIATIKRLRAGTATNTISKREDEISFIKFSLNISVMTFSIHKKCWFLHFIT
jgi:hypothetical protein